MDLKEYPLVSVVILNYQGLNLIEECIKRVLNSTYKNIEIIFIDNNSNDGSFEKALNILKDKKNSIIIKNHENIGFTKGFNQGLKMSHGDLILLLNNDAFIFEDSIENYVKFFKENPDVGLAEGRIINLKDDIIIGVSTPDIINIFGILHEYVEIPSDDYLKRKTRIFSPVGVWPMIKKEVYNKVGGYDDDFFMFEEIRDLSYRVLLNGYKVGYVYDARTYHIGRTTRPKENYGNQIKNLLIFHQTKNQLMFFYKNFSKITIIKYIIPYTFLKIFDIIQSYFRLDKYTFKSKLAGYVWFIKNLNYIKNKRKIIQKNRIIDDKEILKYLIPFQINLIKKVYLMRKNYLNKIS
jgi:GT2 family glycosyltransferase